MVQINPCAVFGTLLVFTGTILIAVGASLPQFVDVFIVQLESDVDSSTPVGGVGVFTSFYDSGLIDPAIIAASGFPDDKFEEPSTEFRLLFPAQENFVVEILPVNDALADALGEATGNVNVADAIKGLLAPMNAREFDNCENYWNNTSDDLSALFEFLQTSVVPGAVQVLGETFRSTFEQNIKQISFVLGSTNTTENPSSQLLFGALTTLFTQMAASEDQACVAVAASGFGANVDATTAGCIATDADILIAALPALNQPLTAGLFGFIKAHFSDANAVCLNNNVLACFNAITFNLDDTPPAAEATFNGVAAGDIVTPCNYLIADCTGVTKGAFFQSIAGLLNENGGAGAAGAIAIYLQAFSNPNFAGLGVSPVVSTADSTFVDPSQAADLLLPTAFADQYVPCIFGNIFNLVLDPTNVDFNSPTCAFEDYFTRSSVIIQAGAAAADEGSEEQESLLATLALVQQISGLYDACREGQLEENPTPFTVACPLLFQVGTLQGLYGDDISAADPAGTATAACEEDDIDKEKIGQAQVSIIVSFIFYGLAVICASLGFLLPVAIYAFSCAGISSFLAGVLTLGALLIVQSAPVYDGVGDPINGDFDPENDIKDDLEFEDFLTEGTSALLAVIAFIIMFVAGASFIFAVVLETMTNKAVEDDFEDKFVAKQDKEVVAAKGQAVEVEEEEEAVDVEGGGKVTI